MSFPSGSSFSSYRFISDLVNIKRKKRNTLMYHAVVVRDIKTFFTSFVTFFFLSLSCKPDLLADFFCWLCAIGNDQEYFTQKLSLMMSCVSYPCSSAGLALAQMMCIRCWNCSADAFLTIMSSTEYFLCLPSHEIRNSTAGFFL